MEETKNLVRYNTVLARIDEMASQEKTDQLHELLVSEVREICKGR
jgi:hypothetical protein